jgi:uncharacterized protein (DUF433 family)
MLGVLLVAAYGSDRAFAARRQRGRSHGAGVRRKRIEMNWKECALVEIVPGRLSGEPVIKGSRVRPDDLVVNRAEGEAWLAENYELPIETVREVLRFYDRHKPTP